MAKYQPAGEEGTKGSWKKVLFTTDAADFDEAAAKLEDIIPEPYSAARVLGKAPNMSDEQVKSEGWVVLNASNSGATASLESLQYHLDDEGVDCVVKPAMYIELGDGTFVFACKDPGGNLLVTEPASYPASELTEGELVNRIRESWSN